jgi:hypothetical protein
MLASNELLGEVGFECTCQRCLVGSSNSINIAAIRAFPGHNGNPTPDLSCSASVEVLGNLNAEDTSTGRVNSLLQRS